MRFLRLTRSASQPIGKPQHRIQDGERQALQHAELAVGELQVFLDGLRQHGQHGAVREVQRAEHQQHRDQPASGSRGDSSALALPAAPPSGNVAHDRPSMGASLSGKIVQPFPGAIAAIAAAGSAGMLRAAMVTTLHGDVSDSTRLSDPASRMVPRCWCWWRCSRRTGCCCTDAALPPYQGQWAPPGGFVEAGESLEAAAIREVREEAGIALQAAQLDPVRGHQPAADEPGALRVHRAAARPGFPSTATPPESLEVGWFTESQMRALDNWDPAAQHRDRRPVRVLSRARLRVHPADRRIPARDRLRRNPLPAALTERSHACIR